MNIHEKSIDILKKLTKKKKVKKSAPDEISQVYEADSGSDSDDDVIDQLDHKRGVVMTSDGEDLTSGRFYHQWRRSSSFDRDVRHVLKSERNEELDRKLAKIEDEGEVEESEEVKNEETEVQIEAEVGQDDPRWSNMANPSTSILVLPKKIETFDEDNESLKSSDSKSSELEAPEVLEDSQEYVISLNSTFLTRTFDRTYGHALTSRP